MTHSAVIDRKPGSITFRVDDVEPTTDLLPVTKTHEGLAKLLEGRVESACDYTSEIVDGVQTHPLVTAVHLAFASHRPLVLSPDMIWLTLVQGFAHHVAANPEELRARLVSHEGKKTVVVERPDFVLGSPENPWPQVFHAFSEKIREEVKTEGYELLVEGFSTTGPVERAAYEIALLDAYAPFFDLVFYAGCGIPTVTLEGTAEDWRRIATKAARFADWGLDWWTKELVPVVEQLARAAGGVVDLTFWREIYKLEKAYGADVTNGWFAKLVPYVKDPVTGRPTRRNPLVTEGKAIRSDCLPTGLSQVSFVWKDRRIERRMEFLAGVVGITQDKATRALRPKIGWAVREAPEIDQLLHKLNRHSAAPPLRADEVSKALLRDGVPGDLTRLYLHCNGATIRERGTGELVAKIYSLERLARGRQILTFGELGDGSKLGVLRERSGWSIFAYREKDLPDSTDFRWPPLAREQRRPVAESVVGALRKLLDQAGDLAPAA